MKRYTSYKKHITHERVRGVFTGLAILILAVGVACTATEGFTNANPYGWFDTEEEQNLEETDDLETSNLIVTPQSTGKVRLTAVRLASATTAEGVANSDDEDIDTQSDDEEIAQEEDGITALSEDYGISLMSVDVPTSYLLTATCDAKELNKFVWSIAFEDPNSDWATGKSAEDYVTMSVDDSNSSCATVSYKDGFSEPIIVTAASYYNKNVNATCRVDYLKRQVDYIQFQECMQTSFMSTFVKYKFGEVNHPLFYFDDDALGTVEGTITATSITIHLGTYLQEQMYNALDEGQSRYGIYESITIQPDQVIDPFDFIYIKDDDTTDEREEIENDEYCQLAYNKLCYLSTTSLYLQVRLNDVHFTVNYRVSYNGEVMYSGSVNAGAPTRDVDQYEGRQAWFNSDNLTQYEVVTSTSLDEDEIVF